MTTPQQKLAVKKWKAKNQDKIKEYREKNKEKQAIAVKEWGEKNKEKIAKTRADWYQKNKTRVNQRQKEYQQKHNHIKRWRNILKATLDRLNKEKTYSTTQMLGYSANELKEHLDKQGMNWDEHEIDHKIPITWFKSETPPHVVNDLRNLHPLTKEENNKKLNKYNHPIDKEYYDLILKHIKNEYKENIK